MAIANIPDSPVFENEITQSIANQILELNQNSSGPTIKILSPQTALVERPSGAQMVNNDPDSIDARLAGFPDLRLQEKVNDRLAATQGFNLQNPVSGMTLVIMDKIGEEDKPIAVANYVLFNPERVAEQKYLLKTPTGLQVVDFATAFEWQGDLPYIFTPGWHYVLEDKRFNQTIVKSGLAAIEIMVKGVNEIMHKANASCLIIAEQNGISFEHGGDIPDISLFEEGTEINKDDPRLKYKTSKGDIINFYDIVGVPSHESRAIGNFAKRKGLRMQNNVSHIETFGPIFYIDIDAWGNKEKES